MHPFATMLNLNTVKDVMHTIGDNTGDYAKRFGANTADIAKRVGSGTADLATRVGPKRAIIGLVVLAAAVGGSIFLVRYLRSRNIEEEIETGDEATGDNRGRKGNKRQRAGENFAH